MGCISLHGVLKHHSSLPCDIIYTFYSLAGFLNDLSFLTLHLCVNLCAGMCSECNTSGGQKVLLDPLELVLQEDVSCPKWVLKPKPRSLQEQSAF